jgi:hypothetical protein
MKIAIKIYIHQNNKIKNKEKDISKILLITLPHPSNAEYLYSKTRIGHNL